MRVVKAILSLSYICPCLSSCRDYIYSLFAKLMHLLLELKQLSRFASPARKSFQAAMAEWAGGRGGGGWVRFRGWAEGGGTVKDFCEERVSGLCRRRARELGYPIGPAKTLENVERGGGRALGDGVCGSSCPDPPVAVSGAYL